MKEYDVVLLKDGREVTLIDDLENGKAFMAEYMKNGKVIDSFVIVHPEDVVKITYVAK